MIDFKQITATTNRYNFHSHTQFCDGHATMAQFAQAAVNAGFKHWGFTPHSPVPIDSPCNMRADKVAAYLDEVRRLNELYRDKTQFYAAMEVDYLGDHWGPSHPFFTSLGLDYIIGSIHFIPTPSGELVDVDGSPSSFMEKMERFFDNDIRYVVDTFFDASLAMIDKGGFDIIGHFDKIGRNATHHSPGIEDEKWYRERVNELIDSIVASGITVEINTKAHPDIGRFFPHQRYWKRLRDAGVTIVVDSDAHRTELIDASRHEALEMLCNA